MPVTVNVGELLECDGTDNIRTRGCDPCVALIVIYQNGQNGAIAKRCAHFSVDYGPPYTQARVDASLDPVLTDYFPLNGNTIRAVGFTWGGNAAGMGSVQIFNRLTQYFNGLDVQSSTTKDSITTNGEEILILDNQNQWVFTNQPASNSLAELKLPK
ncbi:hypothetical protein [Pseudomonas donghuensis]|uniref:hypothetical protein n=1 Tax=Pseudomonas donghuensis TaxID=1163398 RepID=UPI002E124D9B|nr:hypothetical protein VP780_14385 [Pseudomonas donghuensis]